MNPEKTQTENAHTPLPWTLRPADDEHCFDYVEIAPARFILTEGNTLDEANANAALIVRAVNGRQALLDFANCFEVQGDFLFPIRNIGRLAELHKAALAQEATQ